MMHDVQSVALCVLDPHVTISQACICSLLMSVIPARRVAAAWPKPWVW